MNSAYFDSVFLYLDDYTVTMFRSNSGEQLRRPDLAYSDFQGQFEPYSLHWITSDSPLYPYRTLSGSLPANGLFELLGAPGSKVHGVLAFGINDELFTSSLVNCKITASSCVTLVRDGKLQFASSDLFGTATLEALSDSDLPPSVRWRPEPRPRPASPGSWGTTTSSTAPWLMRIWACWPSSPWMRCT